MKPYVGILIDSFWEAVSNKILWALLVTSTFLLAALAPFGLVIERNFQFGTYDVFDHQRLVTKLARGLDRKGNSGLAAIAQKLTPSTAEKVRRQSQEKDGTLNVRELTEELNRLLILPDLYTQAAFPTAAKRERLQPLIERLGKSEPLDKGKQFGGSILQEDLQQLNSELLQITLAPELGPPRGEQIWVGYAGFRFGTPLAITQKQIKTYVEPLILQLVVQFGLGVMIVFVAIIVTSPIIPDTFRSGALHLMLSKPISRTWLFLSKFAGGCIFVLLNLTYVLFGLYLIVGLRFGIWNAGLLACIPLLLFVYIIFYSVSALAGLIWGNAIVSVVVSIVFWVFCFAIGTMHDILQVRAQQWPLIHRIAEVHEKIVVVTEAGVVSVWNDEHQVWQPATEFSVRAEGTTSTTFGPFFDGQRNRLLVKTFLAFSPFENIRGQRNRSMTIVPLDETSEPPKDVEQARSTPLWNTLPGPEIPEQVFRVIELDGQLIVISRLGLYRIEFQRIDEANSIGRSLFGLPIGTAFENVTPRGFRLTDNTNAVRATGDAMISYTSGNLSRLQLQTNRFHVISERKLDGEGSEAALLAANETYCIVARDNLPILLLDQEFSPIQEFQLSDGEKPKQLSWIPGRNCLAILSQTGRLFELDCDGRSMKERLVPLEGKLTCLIWKDEKRAWFGVSPNQVSLVNLETGEIDRQLSPKPKTSEWIYSRIVSPLYRYNPKPSALNQSMQYVLTGSKTFDPNLITVKLDSAKVELEVWQPIISNLAFVVVVLGLSCVYLARKEY